MSFNSLTNRVLFFTMFLLSCSNVVAQEDTLSYKFSFQVGGQRKTGVFSQTAINVMATAKLENKKLALDHLSSYTYTDANGLNIANDWHFRTIVMYKPDSVGIFLPALGHDFLKNVLYKINYSHKFLAGIRIFPVPSYRNFSFLVGAGYEISNYTEEQFLNSPLVANQRNFAVGVFNLLGQHKLLKNHLIIEYNVSFSQSFREATDFAFLIRLGASIPLGKLFFIGVNYEYRFRNVHLEDIPSVNDLLSFSLKCNIAS